MCLNVDVLALIVNVYEIVDVNEYSNDIFLIKRFEMDKT